MLIYRFFASSLLVDRFESDIWTVRKYHKSERLVGVARVLRRDLHRGFTMEELDWVGCE